jgi:hypothetical protein
MLFAASHVSVSLRYFSNLEVTISQFWGINNGERLKKIDVFFSVIILFRQRIGTKHTIDIKTRFFQALYD